MCRVWLLRSILHVCDQVSSSRCAKRKRCKKRVSAEERGMEIHYARSSTSTRTAFPWTARRPFSFSYHAVQSLTTPLPSTIPISPSLARIDIGALKLLDFFVSESSATFPLLQLGPWKRRSKQKPRFLLKRRSMISSSIFYEGEA